MPTETLLANLHDKNLYAHPTTSFSQLETHCSYVLLTGEYAYKIKKPVNFGFLDYSDLAKRKHFCEEEVKRNQAMAGSVYLNVMPVYGSIEAPSFTAVGEPIEYAVKMREFSQDNLLSKVQAEKRLTTTMIDKLAQNLADFHLSAPPVPNELAIGSAEHAQQQTADNFTQTLPLLTDSKDIAELKALQLEVETLYEKIKPVIDRRKQTGFVRQCHGDVHLNNIVLIDDEPVIFDCIDFNDDFCWTDTMADVAFITMDLDEFGEHPLSWRLLNQYLELSGDYDGLNVLAYFQSYRAMVRAKVAQFTLVNCESQAEKTTQYQRYLGCVALARHYLQPLTKRLLITSGVSASGKSTLAKHIQVELDLIRITSDRERKRLANIKLTEDCTADVLAGIYQNAHTENTYQTLSTLAETIIAAGYPVLVDATFRKHKYRQQFAKIAAHLNVPFAILYCHAPEAQLRQWLNERQASSDNVSEATQDVLSMQLEQFESPLETDAEHTLEINTANPPTFATIINDIKEQHTSNTQ